MNSNYYDLFHISQNATDAEIQAAFDSAINYLYQEKVEGRLSIAEYTQNYRAYSAMKDILLNPAQRAQYDRSIGIEPDPFEPPTGPNTQPPAGNNNPPVDPTNPPVDPNNLAAATGATVPSGPTAQPPAVKSGIKKWLARGLIVGAICATVAVAAIFVPKLLKGQNLVNFNKDNNNNQSSVVIPDDATQYTSPGTTSSQAPGESQAPSGSAAPEGSATPGSESSSTPEDGQVGSNGQGNTDGVTNANPPLNSAVNYGKISDDTLVQKRAATLVDQLKALNISNPTTGAFYSVDEIVTLIKYANGVYTPSSLEEIDVLHLSLLNLLISPLNTDQYLYHVVYASGNDDFKDLAVEAANSMKPVDFGSAFAEYETNGVYPLTRWMQEKREQIYSTTDRAEINKIYVEVGQVMADIMKGNGCTITVFDGKNDVTYTYTSEQILANHASAMLLTIDAQLIFANKLEVRDANDRVVESSQTVWQVYNKFNGPEPDQVSLDEIQAWINNGCDYEWGIESVLIDGQTFGQRIQGDMEGMAQNNYAMTSGTKLTK